MVDYCSNKIVNRNVIFFLLRFWVFFCSGKFYRWAKGAQIRGNLDMLESWAAECGLQDESSHYLKRLSTAADLLATPKVQLLQVSNRYRESEENLKLKILEESTF